MSDTNNQDPNYLSIPMDAFEQFQANAMYEEEEYITLSDIVSPEPVVQEFPSDNSEIPFDNEVVLGENYVPISDVDPTGVNNTEQLRQSNEAAEDTPTVLKDDVSNEPLLLTGVNNSDQHNSATTTVPKDDVSIEQPVEQLPDDNIPSRPRRARKKNLYVEDFVVDDIKLPHLDTKKKGNKTTPTTKSRRGRKPRQPKSSVQNEMSQSESTNRENSIEKPHKPSRGRRKTASQASEEKISQETPETEPSTDMDVTDSAKQNKDKTRHRKQSHLKEESLNNSQDSALEPQDTHESVRHKRGNAKKRGRSKKIKEEKTDQYLVESIEKLNDFVSSCQPSEDNLKKSYSNETSPKKPTKRGRKRKQQQDLTTANDKNDTDDELDNVSLKTLSMNNGDTLLPIQDVETTNAPNDNTDIAQQSQYEEIDVGDENNLNQLNEISNVENENKPNTEVQDMELDETVESISNSELNNVSSENTACKFENGDEDATNQPENDLLLEDVSKRPSRRRAKKIMHYDEGSDEDPFANVELSDDEPSGKKSRYYSDDEYIPGSEKKKGNRTRDSISSEDSDISEIDEDLQELQKGKRKRLFSSAKSPSKKGKRGHNDKLQDVNVTTISPKANEDVDDIEVCLQSSVIQANDGAGKKISSVYTNEFENFIAQKIQGTNIKIKKVSSDQSLPRTPLEIPVLDQSAKKTVETSVQTNKVTMVATAVQTNMQHEISMKDNVSLTAEQSEKACEFLKNIVKTTSDLGKLMTEKSDGFITKKINTSNVTDTLKMDYCVKKSFLLLKLAKHNIVQMEEDLGKQYEEFLKQTDLIKHKQEEKIIKPREKDNDSDCEIVEESRPAVQVKQNKSTFNPKTVFLNKELSIKMAKKPASTTAAEKCKKTLNIKNKTAVWISDTVMVKKVKPTQSFLAQDSRNKKPPDCFVTDKMVSDFFDSYYRKLAPSICAPFTTAEWLALGKNYVCNYFFIKSANMSDATTSSLENSEIHNENFKSVSNKTETVTPKSLISMCTNVLKKHMTLCNGYTQKNYSHINYKATDLSQHQSPKSLLQLCLMVISGDLSTEKSSISNNGKPKQDLDHEVLNSVWADNETTNIEVIEHPDDDETEELVDFKSMKELVDIEETIALLNKEPTKVIFECHETDSLCNVESSSKSPKCIAMLKTLCYRRIKIILFPVSIDQESSALEYGDTISEDSYTFSEVGSYDPSVIDNYKIDDIIADLNSVVKNEVKSLFSLTVEKLQKCQKNYYNITENLKETISLRHVRLEDTLAKTNHPNSLKNLAFQIVKNMMYQHENVLQSMDNTIKPKSRHCVVPLYTVRRLADICFDIISVYTNDNPENEKQVEDTSVGLTINCVNTVTEEAFHNMEEDNLENGANFYDEGDYDEVFNYEDNNEEEDINWDSQLQLQEFKPCLVTGRQSIESEVSEDQNIVSAKNVPEEEPVIAHVKVEPLDYEPESVIDSTIVKTEPLQSNEMAIIPESVITKQETNEDVNNDRERIPLVRQDSSSFDEHSFENFVSLNKMMHPLDDPDSEMYSQSGVRIRRQHKPDYMNEYDPSLNLLVPQTFEPSSVENAKGVLMESSSDEEDNNQKSNSNRNKKGDKRGRGRPKKGETKQQNKETKGKVPPPPPVSEVAMLTRRMRDKIRQEEKKVKSSDSEGDDLPLTRKKEKARKENDTTKTDKEKSARTDEIQCSNVDSTEQIEQSNSPEDVRNFTGFSTVDQNEINSYQKYVKYVYDKILPKHTESIGEDDAQGGLQNNVQESSTNVIIENNRSESPLINYDEPAEMLECEPIMPIFDDCMQEKRKRAKSKSKSIKEKETAVPQNDKQLEGSVEKEQQQLVKETKPVYSERDGWHCYPIKPNETKLYASTAIVLDKLPESFVETYFEYQEISHRQNEDKEVDRLINLNTLNRSSMKEGQKVKGQKGTRDEQSGKTIDNSRAATPTSDGCAELTASEDEDANVDDELPPPVASKHTSDNILAKSSLMDDSDSDEPLSKEKDEGDPHSAAAKQRKKSKKAVQEQQVKSEQSDSLMLTADKMMNKELNLLHAPVILSNEVTGKEDKGPSPKNKHKRERKSQSTRDHIKNDEDSSSEEEKQWVSTKEKLLKRLDKRQDTTNADDAKRAKLVSEFIERRGVGPETRKRGLRGRKRSSKKRMERNKQWRVLSNELYGTSSDAVGTRHQFSQSYFKGRRNIRKVIDKKSLARSTVIANMEEFERKCRLNQRQAQLRELLGCEEDVNVLVINDEVCLEYGFEENCPVVSVHPFFTKVMKAHQYEGVKFMWDACFESLEKVESGHPGGGCILAHCMGLGKTLQVLALLHTVLTHPRVGMQRVLVCCPLSTVLNWVDEIHKWIGPVTDQIKVFELSKLKKTYERAYQLEDWYSGGGIFIIGYELFRSLTTLDPEFDDIRPTIVHKIRTALLDPGPDIIICDEGHLLKNDSSVLAVAMSRVATKRRIVLTGTPMQNNLREYYCMVNFVKPNLLGTYSEYSNRFENPIMNGQHRDSREEDIKLMKQRTHILHKVLEGCLQRQEASVLYPYLPKKHEYTVFISLTQVQWDLYKHYVNNYGNRTKQSVLRDFHILQKIWSHPLVLHNFQTKSRDEAKLKQEKLEDDLAHEDLTSEVLKSEDAKLSETDVWWLQYLDGGKQLDSLECSNKFVVIFKILDECIALGDKVLIFSTSLFTMDALEHFLSKINKWSLGQEYYRLDGSVPPEVRQKWCREFNAEHNLKTKLFLISTRAGSLGLNMVAANRVIILDTSWNPAHDIQSIFRVYRFGQKKDCYIYRLVALGTMEQKIYERSVTKQAVSCRVVDEQQIDRHYNMAELTELYKYDELGLSVSAGVAVGVTDVALLRVARLAALHAVHEHDSLLRGSSEQQLPEHERNAAWQQFQQEHETKQIQNQLTSSFSLHFATTPTAPPSLLTYQNLVKATGHQPEIKQEIPNLLVPKPQGLTNESKKKRGKKKGTVEEPPPPETPQDEVSTDVKEDMAKKIMNILIQNNFHIRQEPGEITELVSTVRKIISDGTIPKGSFRNNKKIAQQIAEVLLMKDSPAPALPQVETNSLHQTRKRGRPRKPLVTEEPEVSAPIHPPVEPQPSTSQFDDAAISLGKRRAAINAEKKLGSLKKSVIEEEICTDDDRGDENWQADDSDGEEIVPEAKQKKTTPETAEPTVTVKAEKDPEPQYDSIVLSDDDEPVPSKQTKKIETVTQEKKAESQEIIPLHPSLLSNKNFIKIVAHTYLEGNPMLDDDAAMLAAQYSTLKAKKEIEETGKPISSGPIYDIAVKVLGIDILKKLHKANPALKATPKPIEVKTEAVESNNKKPEQIENKDAGQVENNKKPGQVESKHPVQTESDKKPGPKLKAKRIAELTGRNSPKPTITAPSSPAVVPVGLINRAGNITPNMAAPPRAPLAPLAPLGPLAPPPSEESILPDDDDVTPTPASVPVVPKAIFRKNAKPLVLNSVLAKTRPQTEVLPPQKTIPKLVISAGKLRPATGFLQVAPSPPETAGAPQTITTQQDTICLDSDEETITNEPAPKPKKRVAIKSTAKPHKPHAPAPAPAPAPPVPVSLTAANPQLNAMLQRQHAPPGQILNLLPHQYPPQIPQPQVSGGMITLAPTQPTDMTGGMMPGGRFVLMPPQGMQHLTRLPVGVLPPAGPIHPISNYIPQPLPAYSTYQNMYQPPPLQQQPIQTHALAPDSILPTQRPPPPAPAPPHGKTLCRPGDILRITKTGAIEVLNRDENDVSIVPDDVDASTGRLRNDRPPITSSKTSEPPKSAQTPEKSANLPSQKNYVPQKKTDKNPRQSRKIMVSSSSSSDDDSRPSSPAPRAASPDPLDILKDVVHIRAPDEDKPQQRSAYKTSNVGYTSISKSSGQLNKGNASNSKISSNEQVKIAPKPSKPGPVTQDDILKHISKTDTILKKLDKALTKPQVASRRSATTVNKPTPTTSSTIDLDTIDLDSYERPSNLQQTKQTVPLNRQPAPANTGNKSTPAPQSKSLLKAAGKFKAAEPKKIVGTSKDIIISVTGKSKSLSTTNSVANTGRVSSSAPSPSTSATGVKKRPATVEAGPQKKKPAPMTLKDFNIDDIDDIIELD